MFVRSAPFVKTVREWAALSPRGGFEQAARLYAKANMVAVILRGDDTAVSFLHDVESGKVVKTTHRAVEWAA